MTITKYYRYLKIDDVILFSGAKLIVEAIHRCRAKDGHPAVYFTVSPWDRAAIESLGWFYATGTYGGNDDLTVAVVGHRSNLKRFMLYVDCIDEFDECANICYSFDTQTEAEEYAEAHFSDSWYSYDIVDRYEESEDFDE